MVLNGARNDSKTNSKCNYSSWMRNALWFGLINETHIIKNAC